MVVSPLPRPEADTPVHLPMSAMGRKQTSHHFRCGMTGMLWEAIRLLLDKKGEWLSSIWYQVFWERLRVVSE